MKTAIITVTVNGANLAQKLQANLTDSVIFVKKDRYTISLAENIQEYTVMSKLIAKIFSEYDALIFFTSTGIAVRMIAPYIVHKVKDPAVVVLDEQAKFAISLLSGHLGGANELTKNIAQILQAVPVITTATDINKLLAPDEIARKCDLVPYPLTHIKVINSALVQGKQIRYYIDETYEQKEQIQARLKMDFQIKAEIINADKINLSYTPCVLITPKRQVRTHVLNLTEKRLIMGIGCRKDVDIFLVEKAIAEAKKLAKCEHLKIKNLVSTVVKKDEPALLLWAKNHQVQTHFYNNEVMQNVIDKYKLEESAFVKKQIGIGNVCQASILAYNEKAKIILPKTKFEKVTVSLAWE